MHNHFDLLCWMRRFSTFNVTSTNRSRVQSCPIWMNLDAPVKMSHLGLLGTSSAQIGMSLCNLTINLLEAMLSAIPIVRKRTFINLSGTTGRRTHIGLEATLTLTRH